ncbi:MAG: leucine-rich repeat domain-containing protein [Oscillospiraceae bacterium]|nr:leucine-rich repeat domain-containing protein [Oscillospiraceae bacterium]
MRKFISTIIAAAMVLAMTAIMPITASADTITIKDEEYSTDLTELNLYNKGLTNEDIQPLVLMTNLTKLNLAMNSISDFSPISGLTNLEELHLSGNPDNTDISVLTNLKELKMLLLTSTNITDISVLSELPNLTTLALDYTKTITNFEVVWGLTDLELLQIGRTEITDISGITSLIKLGALSLDDNPIEDFSPLSALTELFFLSLNGTGISDFSPLSGLTTLTTLHLNNTGISDISQLSEMTNLTVLHLSENPLTLAQIDELRLALPDCFILHDAVAGCEFCGKHPDFCGCYPTPPNFNKNDYQKLVAFAQQGDNLAKLGWDLDDPANWDGIYWHNIWSANIRVQTINFALVSGLSGKLDASNFADLTGLYVPNGQLTEVDVSGSTEIKELHVDNNNLVAIDVSDLTKLEWLWVSQNQLEELDVSNNTKLEILNIYSNNISVLDVSENIELVTLDVRHNNLEELDVSNSPKLRTVNIANNKFITLSTFDKLTQLVNFGARGNEIDLRDPAIRRSIYTIRATVKGNAPNGSRYFCPQNNGVRCCDECDVSDGAICYCECFDDPPPILPTPTALPDMRGFAAIAIALLGTSTALWVYTRRKRT